MFAALTTLTALSLLLLQRPLPLYRVIVIAENPFTLGARTTFIGSITVGACGTFPLRTVAIGA